MFHFGQSIMKKLNSLGLKTEYKENYEFQNWIKMIFTLALIPIDKILGQWEIIMHTRPQVERIEDYTDYFVDNYFEGRFRMELLNHFLTTGEPRTNNHLEGYNLKLKKCVVTAHPDIFTAKILQEEEMTATIKYLKE